jgi:CheY-like chemotaxis protein
VPWLGDPEAERAEQKASRRAQVRRERQRDTGPGELESDAPAILVFCAVDASSSPLCTLLRAFGFSVTTTRDMPSLPAPWAFVVVFVDVTQGALPVADAIELCNRVRESSRLPGERRPALMLVADQLSSTDRVRAGLAGCNEVIIGPIARGSVAGALEARGIKLPSDARRG